MKEKNSVSDIKNLIALCHIIDDFEEFEKRLLQVISCSNNRNFVFQLWDVSSEKGSLMFAKAKKFYLENKDVIDLINKYSNVPTFINLNYDFSGEKNGDFQFFYKYILSNKNNIDKILALLEKLKTLGFGMINFNSELDFTEDSYKVYTTFSKNFDIIYLNNLFVVPGYNPGILSYKTMGSHYKITLRTSGDKIQRYYKQIILNDLMFDINELPDNVSKEETFDKLLELKEKKQYEFSLVKDSVNLGVGIIDLYRMCDIVNLKVNNLENVEKKDELIELLEFIKETILKMQVISSEYNKNISLNSSISEVFLEEQKGEYIKRREFHDLD